MVESRAQALRRQEEAKRTFRENDAAHPGHYSAHISKEIMSYLATRPNRFMYVHTPKYGSC